MLGTFVAAFVWLTVGIEQAIKSQSERCVMNLTRLALVVIVLIGSAAVARADGLPVDPKMDVSDPTCTTSSCPNPVGPNQGFQFTVVPNSPGSTDCGGGFMATHES